MAIAYSCPKCGTKHYFADDMANCKDRCRNCSEDFVIPDVHSNETVSDLKSMAGKGISSTPINYIKQFFTSNYFNFKGRARRSEYFWATLGLFIAFVVLGIIISKIGPDPETAAMNEIRSLARSELKDLTPEERAEFEIMKIPPEEKEKLKINKMSPKERIEFGLKRAKMSDQQQDEGSSFVRVIAWLISIYLLIPSWALCVRRFHDLGKSGFGIVLFFVPIANIVVPFSLLFRKGELGPNKYGQDPKRPHV